MPVSLPSVTFALPLLAGLAVLLGAAACWAWRREHQRRVRAEQALRQSQADLEAQVAARTVALREALLRVRGFAAELDEGVETERRRLAREVHDQIGQVGTATKILVLALRRKLGPDHEESLGELLALADEAIQTARGISAALRPPLLDDFGLAAALEHYAKGLVRPDELQLQVDVGGDTVLSAVQANQLFRIGQEAGGRLLRQAGARQLRLCGRQVDAGYRFEIIDSGEGAAGAPAEAAALRHLHERAALAGGRVEVGRGPQGGTHVSVLLPLAAPMTEEAAA